MLLDEGKLLEVAVEDLVDLGPDRPGAVLLLWGGLPHGDHVVGVDLREKKQRIGIIGSVSFPICMIKLHETNYLRVLKYP